jgi:starch synthase
MMRKVYKYDPLFANNCKVVYTIYNDSFSGSIDKDFARKLVEKEVTMDDLERIKEPTWENLTKFAIDYSDGVILGSKDINPEIIEYIKQNGKPMLEYSEDDKLAENCENFYVTVIEK